jgi:hypothetical protein
MFSKELQKARAKFEIVKISGKSGVIDVAIPEIPLERTQFLDTTDEWQRVIMPNSTNTSACMFYAKKNNFFGYHRHLENTEQLVILNKGGKIKVVTENEVKIIEYPNSVFFDKREKHLVYWMEDTDALIIWHPEFTKGWEAEIEIEKEK